MEQLTCVFKWRSNYALFRNGEFGGCFRAFTFMPGGSFSFSFAQSTLKFKFPSSLTSFSRVFLKMPPFNPSVYFMMMITSINSQASDVIRIIRQVLIRIFPRNILVQFDIDFPCSCRLMSDIFDSFIQAMWALNNLRWHKTNENAQ